MICCVVSRVVFLDSLCDENTMIIFCGGEWKGISEDQKRRRNVELTGG